MVFCSIIISGAFHIAKTCCNLDICSIMRSSLGIFLYFVYFFTHFNGGDNFFPVYTRIYVSILANFSGWLEKLLLSADWFFWWLSRRNSLTLHCPNSISHSKKPIYCDPTMTIETKEQLCGVFYSDSFCFFLLILNLDIDFCSNTKKLCQ